MAFQAQIAAEVVVALVSGKEIGRGLGVTPSRVVSVQCEGRDAVDDVIATLANGWKVFFQCKTNVNLSTSPDSSLASTVSQLVRLYPQLGTPNNSRVVLAAGSNSAGTLRQLEQGLRLFDRGSDWAAAIETASTDVADALRLFASHARCVRSELSDSELVKLAQLFTIVRFEEAGRASLFETVDGLTELYGSETAATLARVAIAQIARELIASGAPADRHALLRSLRIAGHCDVDFPPFSQDFAALRSYSRRELSHFARHETLAGNVRIERDCLAALFAAVQTGSVVLTGQPGSGKTGILVALARKLLERHPSTIFLSADSLSGVPSRGRLEDVVGTTHPVLDTLANWPGPTPRFLIIDSLDATRGGPAEQLLQRLISDLLESGDWIIVASVRDFDLQLGRRWRDLFIGSPPSSTHVNEAFTKVRHFATPHLSNAEFDKIKQNSQSIGEILESAPTALLEVLRNVFNLSIAVEMRSTHASVNLADIRTQSELLSQFEDIRLDNQGLKRAAAATVKTMSRVGTLSVRSTDVEHDEIDTLVRRGVLVANSDRVSFAHHVLFDHIAARYFLNHDETGTLLAQVGDGVQALLLAPALKFCIELKFQHAPSSIWRFVISIARSDPSNALVASVCLSTAVSLVRDTPDVAGLTDFIRNREKTSIGKTLERLSRLHHVFAERNLSTEAHIAWANVAREIAQRIDDDSAEALRFFLLTLAQCCDPEPPEFRTAFGTAARALLSFAWSLERRGSLAPIAIRFVARSFHSDPDASRALLSQVLGERLRTSGAVEAPALAGEFEHILRVDSLFAESIFVAVFSHEELDRSTTALGGSQSRILGLTSNRRQDYQHAEWLLREKLDCFLAAHPREATRSISRALISIYERAYPSAPGIATQLGGVRVYVLPHDLRGLLNWRGEQRHGTPEELLGTVTDFLRRCAESTFEEVLHEAASSSFCAPMWSRLLGVAAERSLVPNELWAVASSPNIVRADALAFDTVEFLTVALPRQSVDLRRAYELTVAGALGSESALSEAEQDLLRKLVARVLYRVTDEVTPEFAQLRRDLDAAGAIEANRPRASMSFGWTAGRTISEADRFPDVDLSSRANRTLRDGTAPLEQALEQHRNQQTFSCSSAWSNIIALLSVLEQQEPASTPVLATAWGAIGSTVETIVSDPAHRRNPTAPTHDELAQLAVRLADSCFPEARSEDRERGGVSWSDLDVRVYAARALLVLADLGTVRVSALEKLSRDAVAAVRYQVASGLLAISSQDSAAALRIAEDRARNEQNLDVLQVLLSHTLVRLARTNSSLTEELVRLVEERVDDRTETSREISESIGTLTALLAITTEEVGARNRFGAWLASTPIHDPPVRAAIQDLRNVIFLAYRDNASAQERLYSDRARSLIGSIVKRAAEVMSSLEAIPPEQVSEEARAQYAAADRVLDEVCCQLFFGSGAFNRKDEEEGPGLPSVATMVRFLADYGDILETMAEQASSGSMYRLSQLLEFLVDADPAGVFALLAKMLLGRGAAQQYQGESLAAEHVLRIVGRYLTDFRGVFDAAARRSELLGVLGLFADAGWPAAHRFLFSLPDALR